MAIDWKQKYRNRGSLVVDPLKKGESHDRSTTNLEPDEWLNMRNVTPTTRGLRAETGTEIANTIGSNDASNSVQSFQRADKLRNYVSLGNRDGLSMLATRTGFSPSRMAWSSMGSTTERNIVVTFAAGAPSLSATIAGTYIKDGVTYNILFDATFMLEAGDKLFNPANPAQTSLIKSVTGTTVTFDPAEANVPAGATTLCILYKWQSDTFKSQDGFYLDTAQVGAIKDTGRTPNTQSDTMLPVPNTIVTSLSRPLMMSVAAGGSTRLPDREGFEGMLSIRDGGAAGFTHYPVDGDTVLKSISARSIETFRGFLYMAATYELAYASATAAAWSDIAYSPDLTMFVAITANSNVAGLTVDGGATWIQSNLGPQLDWSRIMWSAALQEFVIVARNSAVGARSPDGRAWTTFDLPSAAAWNGITSGGTLANVIVTANSSSSCFFSDDLITWQEIPLTALGDYSSIAYSEIDKQAIALRANSVISNALRYTPSQQSTDFPYTFINKVRMHYHTSGHTYGIGITKTATGSSVYNYSFYYIKRTSAGVVTTTLMHTINSNSTKTFTSYNTTSGLFITIVQTITLGVAQYRIYSSPDGITLTLCASYDSSWVGPCMIAGTGATIFALRNIGGSGLQTIYSTNGGISWAVSNTSYTSNDTYIFDLSTAGACGESYGYTYTNPSVGVYYWNRQTSHPYAPLNQTPNADILQSTSGEYAVIIGNSFSSTSILYSVTTIGDPLMLRQHLYRDYVLAGSQKMLEPGAAANEVVTFTLNNGLITGSAYKSVNSGLNWSRTADINTAGKLFFYEPHSAKYYCAVGTVLYSSADLITWGAVTVSAPANIISFVWHAYLSLYAVICYGGTVYTTPDLSAYTLKFTDLNISEGWCFSVYNMVVIQQRYTNPNINVITSVTRDFTSFYSQPLSTTGPIMPPVFDPVAKKFIGGNVANAVASYSWKFGLAGYPVTLPSAAAWCDIAYNSVAALFMAIASGTTNAASSSPTGTTWAARTMSASTDWRAIVSTESADVNAFIAVASGGTVANDYKVSTTTWRASTLSESANYRGIAYSPATKRAIAVATGSTIGSYSAEAVGSPFALTWADTTLFTTVKWQLYGTRIRWSLSSDMRNFTNALSYIDLPEHNSQILKIMSDGQRLIAYLENTIYYAVATGDADLPFTFLKIETGGVGLIAQPAVCRIQGAHIFVGRNSVYLLNNLVLTKIGDPIVDVTIRILANPSLTQCYYNEVRNLVYFGFAVHNATAIDEVWVLSLDSKTWSRLSYGETIRALNGYYVADSDTTFRQRTFYLDNPSYGVVTAHARLDSDQLTASNNERFLETGDLDFGDPDQVKEFFRIKFNIDENEFGAVRTESILFTVAYSTDFGVTYRRLPEQLRIPVGQQEGYVTFRAISNYIRFKFSSVSNLAPYTITGYTIDMKMMQPSQTLKLSGGQL